MAKDIRLPGFGQDVAGGEGGVAISAHLRIINDAGKGDYDGLLGGNQSDCVDYVPPLGHGVDIGQALTARFQGVSPGARGGESRGELGLAVIRVSDAAGFAHPSGGLFSAKPAFKALASSLLLARVSVLAPPYSSKVSVQRGFVKQADCRKSASSDFA